MAKKGHRVAAEVRADILRRIKDEGVTVQQAAEEHGLSESTIYDWLAKGVKSAPTWSEVARLKRENATLLQLVGEATLKLSSAQKKN
ncbi:MAG: transposase [Patescibacteria group bacterium]